MTNPVEAALRAVQRRVMAEAIANVGPVHSGLLLPPPRAFLTPVAAGRMAGATAALERLVDAPPPSSVDEVVALHGVLCAGEAGSGRVRDEAVAMRAGASTPPEPGAVRERLAAALAAVAAERSDVEAASGLVVEVLALHPFRDGNGRIARALFVAVLGGADGSAAPGAAIEAWHIDRAAYLAALRASDEAGHPTPFAEFARACEQFAAARRQERAAQLSALASEVATRGLGDAAVERALVLACERVQPGTDPELVAAGLAAATVLPPSRREVGASGPPLPAVRWLGVSPR